MPNYRVKFYKTLLSSDGHGFKCLQRMIDINGAENPDEAIWTAWLECDRAKNGMARYWADLAEADLIETVASGSTLPPHTAPPLVQRTDESRVSPRAARRPLATASDGESS